MPASDTRSGSRRMGWAAICGATFAALFLVVVWTRSFVEGYLFGGAAAILGAGALLVIAHSPRGRVSGRSVPIAGPVDLPAVDETAGRESRRGAARVDSTVVRLLVGALGTLALAVVVGFFVDQRLDRLGTGWEDLVLERQELHTRALDARMARVLNRGREAARQAAVAVAARNAEGGFAALDDVLDRGGIEALAVFDRAGEPVAWAGDHHGPFPPLVRGGGAGVVYADHPLFGYLYFSQPIDGSGATVVAAILLQTGVGPEQHASLGVAERFAERTGARPFFGPGPGGADSWSLVVDGKTIAHAQFESVTQAEWWATIGNSGRRVVLPLAGVALVLLTLAWFRSRPRSGIAGALPLLGLTGVLAVAPLGSALGAERLFSPALFLLPVPPEITLGRLLALILPLAALTAAARPVVLTGGGARVALALGAVAVALGFPAALDLLIDGATPGLLDGVASYWGAFQLAALLLLAMLVVLALPQDRVPRSDRTGSARAAVLVGGGRRAGRRRRSVRPVYIIIGGILALALAGAVLVRWQYDQRIDTWFLALWAVPFVFLALGVRSYVGRAGRLVRWLVAASLAASAVLPYLWVSQVEARLHEAERGLATLGLRPDPFLDYLLHQFAADVVRREARGEENVALLYRSWATSGLAREAYPARIGIWSATGRQEVELVLGDPDAVRRGGPVPTGRLSQARARALETGGAVLEPAMATTQGGRLLAVPLAESRGVTVFVPPRRSFDQPAALVPILGPEPNPETRLTLIPAMAGWDVDPDSIHWQPTEQGWRSEALLHYPESAYHAHLDVHLPPLAVLLARGVLLLALNLGILALLWVIGRAARGDPPSPPGGWPALAGSFRSRVTVALFGFFLLPTLIFGTLAYRALAGEAARTARVVAERAVAQAVAIYPESPGNWRQLSARVGEEILFYHRGELAQASSPEAVELGIFGAWIPPTIYETLRSGEAVSIVENRRLGQRAYVLAYRRLPAGTLAVPVPVMTGEATVRQRELADLVLFAVLLGGALSLALSLAVGRALARPIGLLRRASTAVGGGRLSVRLPETDAGEFGQLFSSFNRMTRRLRRARAQELRSARVLAWGEMSRQVAHEIKNPLTPIKLSVQHLRRAYADGRSDYREILDSNVEQILREIDRLTEIARVFSRYGAPAEAAGPLEVVQVSPVAFETLMLYRAGESGIQYRADLEPELPTVFARTGELKEVLLNLLENAYTALDGRGTVTISSRRVGEAVELMVSDDGPGIPSELLPRIFEPHFSTHSAGTGLGLAIVKRIVEDWGGTINAESVPGEGTTIRIRLRVAGREQVGVV